ncbi:unnamed protein product, partial [Prorocentrum cordatum]
MEKGATTARISRTRREFEEDAATGPPHSARKNLATGFRGNPLSAVRLSAMWLRLRESRVWFPPPPHHHHQPPRPALLDAPTRCLFDVIVSPSFCAVPPALPANRRLPGARERERER